MLIPSQNHAEMFWGIPRVSLVLSWGELGCIAACSSLAEHALSREECVSSPHFQSFLHCLLAASLRAFPGQF